eukprot:m.178524 g.178524  ORF g.178524 m.178524 type:complete len:559 (+) comp17395_c0_seq6:405-2081(+)
MAAQAVKRRSVDEVERYLYSLKVVDLKNLCRLLNLPISGNKPHLQMYILHELRQQGDGGPAARLICEAAGVSLYLPTTDGAGPASQQLSSMPVLPSHAAPQYRAPGTSVATAASAFASASAAAAAAASSAAAALAAATATSTYLYPTPGWAAASSMHRMLSTPPERLGPQFPSTSYLKVSNDLLTPVLMAAKGTATLPPVLYYKVKLPANISEMLTTGGRVFLRCGFKTKEDPKKLQDAFPKFCQWKVNGKVVTENMDHRYRALDIMPFVQHALIGGHQFNVEVVPSRSLASNDFYIAVQVCKRVSADDLLPTIVHVSAAERRETIIAHAKQQRDEDLQVHDTSFVPLSCTISQSRIQLACRGKDCTHVQCFDARTYFHINEKRETWACPVCQKTALPQDLLIDDFFMDILSATGPDDIEIELKGDATWKVREEQTRAAKLGRSATASSVAENGNGVPTRHWEAGGANDPFMQWDSFDCARLPEEINAFLASVDAALPSDSSSSDAGTAPASATASASTVTYGSFGSVSGAAASATPPPPPPPPPTVVGHADNPICID